MRWSLVLACALVGARVLALATGHSSALWLAWSGIVAFIAFVSPTSGVALSVANVFVSLDDESPLGLSVGQIAGGAAAARMLMQVATRRVRLPRLWRPSHLAVAAIAFVMVLSALVSPFHAMPWAPLRKLALIALLYLLTLAYVDTPRRLLFLQYTVVLCAGLAAAWTAGQALTASGLQSRAVGLAGNPNYQAIYCAIALPLAASLVVYLKPGRWRALAIAAAVCMVAGVIATASRGGLLVLGISLVLIVMLWGRRGRVQWFLGVLVVVLVIALTRTDYARVRFGDALGSLRQGTAQEESRVRLADDSLEVWRRHPLLGVGAGNWHAGATQAAGSAAARTAHVWPAQILAEMGALGLGCYLALVLLCVQDYRRAIRHLEELSAPHVDLVRGFLGAVVAMSLAWTSGNPYNQLWFVLLLLSGVCCSRLLGAPGDGRSVCRGMNRGVRVRPRASSACPPGAAGL